MGLFNRRKKRGTDETMQYGAKLITLAKPQNPVSEQFRTVKNNLELLRLILILQVLIIRLRP